jgi:RHS repeat-associated protein
MRACVRRNRVGSRCSGKERDGNGLDYFGARYYDGSAYPATFRWISADSVTAHIYDPPSLNKYAYVRNDPVNLVDRDGHSWTCVWDYVLNRRTERWDFAGGDCFGYDDPGKVTKAMEPRPGGQVLPRTVRLSDECAKLFEKFAAHLKTDSTAIAYMKSDGTTGSVDLTRFYDGLSQVGARKVLFQDDWYAHQNVPENAEAQTTPLSDGLYLVEFGAHPSFSTQNIRFAGIVVHELFHVGQFVAGGGGGIPVFKRDDAERQAEAFSDAYEEWARAGRTECKPF